MTATTRNLLGLALAMGLALTACAATPDPTGPPTMTPPPTEPSPTVASAPTGTPVPASPSGETAILVTIGSVTLQGRLWDNPAARDLAARLPLALTFSDYNAVEKTARLDPALTMAGMPAGDDPTPGEIGWYAPSSDLVLYYGDVGYWNGIARLGTFDTSGTELLAEGPHDVTVSIARTDG